MKRSKSHRSHSPRHAPKGVKHVRGGVGRVAGHPSETYRRVQRGLS